MPPILTPPSHIRSFAIHNYEKSPAGAVALRQGIKRYACRPLLGSLFLAYNNLTPGFYYY